MTKYHIPFYGMAVGVAEYLRAAAAHRAAARRYRRRPTPENFAAVCAAYDRTWEVLEREQVGFISTVIVMALFSLASMIWAALG